MKKCLLLLCLPVLGGPGSAGEPKAPAAAGKPDKPQIKSIARIEDCPEPVRAAVRKNGHDKQLSEIKLIIGADGTKSWSFETGTEEGGRDEETNYYYSSEGALLKTEKDMPLKDAPAAVREALLKLAGTTAVNDDVELVTEGDVVSYKAEVESNGGVDRKVRVSPAGEVLELFEETDD
jgi:hypothetical protein